MNRLATRSLHQICYGLIRLCRFFWKRPKSVLVGFVLLTVAFTLSIKQLKFALSAADLAGDGIATADELDDIKERYADGHTSILLVEPDSNRGAFDRKELCNLRRWYSILRATEPNFKNTTSTFEAVWPVEVDTHITKYQNILNLDCDTVSSATAKDIQLNWPEIRSTLNSYPLAILHDYSEHLSLAFLFRYKDANDPKFGEFNPVILSSLRAEVESSLPGIVPGAKFHWVGPADYQWYVKKGFEKSAWINLAMLLFLLFSLRAVYGTWRAGFLFCTALICGGLWIFGIKALVGSSFDLLSSGLFLLMGVSTLEDFTFLSAEQMKGVTLRTSVRRMIAPSFFTSMTTIVGFLSLEVSNIGLIRRFGMWSAGAAILEWMIVFCVIPALLFHFFENPTWVNPQKALNLNFLKRLLKFSFPRGLSRTLLIVFPLAVLSFHHLSANDNPSHVFPKDHPYRADVNFMGKTRGWTGMAYLLFRDDLPGAEVDRKANTLIQSLAVNGNIMSFESAHSVVSWFNELNVLKRNQIETDYEPTLSRKQLLDSNRVPRVYLYLKETTVEKLQDIKHAASEICPDHSCWAGGDLIAYSDFSTMIPRTLIDSLSMSLMIVGLIVAYLAIALRQRTVLWQMLVASFWGPCLMIFVMAVTKSTMDFQKCIFAGILVGLTGDNAIQFLFASRKIKISHGIEDRGVASIVTTTLMAGTALLYLLSYFTPPRSFGVILASGLFAALIGDIWLLSGLLKKEIRPQPEIQLENLPLEIES